jgi:hypothetical protein
MSLFEVYKQSHIQTAKTSSYLGVGNGFSISLFHNDFYTYNSNYWRLTLDGFTGIMLENLSLNFQTNWGDAGGAVIGKKIESFVNSKFIKFLAGQSEAGFQPFICSDAWTQQKVSGEAQPVKVQLKFKAYNLNKMGCTNYNDILRFLIHICSPLKSATGKNDPNVNLGTHIFYTLDDAAAGGSNLIGLATGAVSTFMNGDKSGASQIAKNLVETVDSSYNKLLSSTGNGKNNANFTVLLSIGDLNDNHGTARKINSSSSIESKYLDKNHQETTADFKLDWIITNFTFKPSMQFEMVKENGGEFPKPLWMDFDVSLETRLSLSNKYVYQTIIPQALTTKINP